MFQTQFILQNFHFIINVVASFIFAAGFWLYLDAWFSRKNTHDALKIVGFLFFSISFLVHAVFIEQNVLQQAFLNPSMIESIAMILRVFGAFFLIGGLVFDPLQKRPHYSQETSLKSIVFGGAPAFLPSVYILSPVLTLVISLLYLRKATIGLERHLKVVSLAFFILFLSDCLSLFSIFRSSSHVVIYNAAGAFGPLWIAEHVLLLLAVVVLGKWVFQYLLRRFQTQFFIIYSTSLLVIFLITTLVFTLLLMNNIRADALNHLKTDVRILQYAIDAKKAELLSTADLIAHDPALREAVLSKNSNKLYEETSRITVAQKEILITIVNSDGKVVMRGEDPERIGDSLSNDSLIHRVLQGEHLSTISVHEGALAPLVSIRSAVPFMDAGSAQGAVMVSTTIDTTFVDGIKSATGLDVAVYGNTTRSATTFIAADGKSRFIGVKEENDHIKKTVLDQGAVYVGGVDILNTAYFTAFAPLIDSDKNPIGMLFVGVEQSSVFQTAARSIQITFVFSIGVLFVLFIFSYLLGRYIRYQTR